MVAVDDIANIWPSMSIKVLICTKTGFNKLNYNTLRRGDKTIRFTECPSC